MRRLASGSKDRGDKSEPGHGKPQDGRKVCRYLALSKTFFRLYGLVAGFNRP